eukprot:1074153-Prymnesium_polylepis.2
MRAGSRAGVGRPGAAAPLLGRGTLSESVRTPGGLICHAWAWARLGQGTGPPVPGRTCDSDASATAASR